MSTLTRLVTRFYAPLVERGALIDGLSIRASAATDGQKSRPSGIACAPLAQPRGSVRTSARPSHAREGRASLAA
jgi:hypothetical protein